MNQVYKFNKYIITGVLVVIALLGQLRETNAQAITGLSDWTLFIDQGHSLYENQGLYGYSEAEKVLRVGLQLKDMFVQQTDIKAVYTARLTDQDNISLEGRVALANTLGVDFYYSIHSDAGGPSSNSTLMLYGGWKSNGVLVEKTPNGGGAYGAILNMDLNGAMRIPRRGNYADRIYYQGDITHHESQWPYLYVNRVSDMTSLLSEAGFHTNPAQQMLNMNADWKTLEALSAFRSFLEWHNIDRPVMGVAAGIIKDIETGLPLNDVTVTIDDKSYVTDGYNSLFKKYSSNPEALRNGFYFIQGLQPLSNVTIQFEKAGYQPISANIDVVSNPNGRTDENLTFFDPLMVSSVPAVVVSVLPAQQPDGLVPGIPLKILFSRKMDQTSLANAISIVPKADFSLTWISEFEVEVATSGFDYLTDYTITIDGGVALNSLTSQNLDGDGDGQAGGNYIFQLTTSDEDTDAPALTDYFPAPHAPARIVRPVVRLVYDEIITASSVASDAIVINASNRPEPIAGVISHHVINEKSVLHFYPTEDLTPGITYTVTIAQGLSDVFNNATQEVSYQFQVLNQPVTQTNVIDNFNNGIINWWNPQQAGQTVGIITEITSRSHDISYVNHSTGSTGSMKLSYGWDASFMGTPYIRQHLPATAAQNGIRFTPDHVLQVYIFGDGSNNQVRLMIRDGLNQLETHQWVTLNWIGWKLVTWDLKNDQAFPWAGVGGNGVLDGTNFYMDGFHLSHVAGAATTGAIYFDQLQVVKREPMVYPTTLHEDFQAYDDFTDNLYPWITVDVNKAETFAPTGFTFPGAGLPYAFRIMNPALTTPAIDNEYPPVEGEKYLFAMQSLEVEEDKWLISPQLRATETSELSFFARSMESVLLGPERIQVFISLDNKEDFVFNKSNFEMISGGDFIEVPDQWTQFSYFLGAHAGKVYRFAIRYVSDDDYMVMLDDIEVKDAQPYTLTLLASPSNGGTLTGAGKYVPNQQVTVKAVAAYGFVFSHWADDKGNKVSSTSEYNFTMAAADKTLTAHFTASAFKLTITVDPAGAGSVTGEGNYFFKDAVTVEATAATGYKFISWTNRSGEILSTNPKYEFLMPDYNYPIRANFETVPVYTLTTVAQPQEGGIVSGGGDYFSGAVIELSAEPAEGYEFVHWTRASQETVSASNVFSFTMPAAATTLTGHFRLKTAVELPVNTTISIYPNPANQFIHIQSQLKVDAVTLMDMTGRIVLVSDETQLNIGNLRNGIYLVKIETGNQSHYRKIQITR